MLSGTLSLGNRANCEKPKTKYLCHFEAKNIYGGEITIVCPDWKESYWTAQLSDHPAIQNFKVSHF
ncbi:MAG: hypothetical protein KME18_02680 [Phormidium tanganyikae FI6-MK23]|jgi:hypothetical protein|nr:hypothetical protein [Phormidium tanganyikae FI6-MK23]